MARIPLVALLASAALTAEPASGNSAGPEAPNVLIIVTDDQRTDTMLPAIMPETLRRFGKEGVTFPNAVATTPLCCPSRAGIMTGRFSHNNGVRTNQDGPALGDHGATLQRYLSGAGYRSALVGKFLNGWRLRDDPPHWHRWSVVRASTGYHETRWNIDGTVTDVTTYSTDYVAERTVHYLDEFDAPATDDQPWFLYVAPQAPHAPFQPAPEYEAADVGGWDGNPAIHETDKTDKPPQVEQASYTLADAQATRTQQLRMLLSVDDMVGDVFTALEANGELENTLAFFLSDNGYLWSEHGLVDKNQPYLPATRIPFLLRWPGHLPAGGVDERLAANIDVAPTVLAAAGLSPPAPMDGTSLLEPPSRTKILTEGWKHYDSGIWASIITPRYQYVERYADDGVGVTFRELYPLASDPWQLDNLLGDGTRKNDSDLDDLSAELGAARVCGAPGQSSCERILSQPVALCSGREGVRADHLVGDAGRDRLAGRGGADLLCGLEGRDVLRGGSGRDLLIGGEGRDTLLGGKGRDVCRGGPGRDRPRSC